MVLEQYPTGRNRPFGRFAFLISAPERRPTSIRSAFALAAALVLAGTAAQAQPPPPGAGITTHVNTVRDLAAVCDPSWDGSLRDQAIAYCQGFLTAAAQYHTMLHPVGGPIRPLYCLPQPGPTIAETGVEFARWAQATPRHADEAALDGFLRWAQARHPCPPARAGRAAQSSR
jgi:hypothetical protein